MRAMALQSPGEALRLIDLPKPEAGPGQVRILVRVCGVCHTDLHVVEGDLPPRKELVIPGHEIVGLVDQVGSDVAGFREGDRAGVPWLYQSDGVCRYCQDGQENLCDAPLFTGYDVDGGYADYIVAPAAFTHHLPSRYPDEAAAPLLCAGVVGFRTIRIAGVEPGEQVAIIGFGASAHIVMQILRHWGCTVFVGTRGSVHQQLARDLGAAWVGPSSELPAGEADRALVFAPAGAVVLDALLAVRKGGTVANGSVYSSPIPEMDYARFLFNERILRSVTAATREDARLFLRMAQEAPIEIETEAFPLERANDALEEVRHSRVRGAAVLRVSEG